jgi:hypothetical protein
MAWLEQHRSSKTFHIVFRLGRERFRQSLRTADKDEANIRLTRLKETIRLVESGRLVLPEHADPAAFLLSDGKLNGKLQVAERITLAELIERYRDALPDGSLEPESLRIAELHMRHFVRILGNRKALWQPVAGRFAALCVEALSRTGQTWFAGQRGDDS